MKTVQIVREYFNNNSPSDQIEALNIALLSFLSQNDSHNGQYATDYLNSVVLNVNTVSELLVKLYEADIIDERFKGRSTE